MHKLHEMLEKIEETMAEQLNKGIDNVDTKEFGDVADIYKDLMCAKKDYLEACYYKAVVEEMNEYDPEDEKSEDYEDFDMRRYYRGQPRSKTSGRFMRRGDGRRNYTPYYHMTPEMYHEHEPEYYRDMDRSEGRMYYSGSGSNPRPAGMERANSTSAGRSRSYYGGESGRDVREGRSGMSRRSYMETKETHSGNSAEEKQHKMKELEKYMSELGTDITEMISDASNEEKTLLKNKLQVLAQKVV